MAESYRVSAISGCSACGEAPLAPYRDGSLGYPLWLDGREVVGPVSIVHAPTPMGEDASAGSSKLGRSLALYVGVPLLSIVGASVLLDVPLSAKSSTKGGGKLLGAAILGVGAAYLIDRGLA